MLVSMVLQLLVTSSTVFASRDGKHSTIGGIEISVKKESEIQGVLADSIAEWRTEPIIVSGQTGTIEISAEMIHFKVKETVANYIEAIKKPWYKPWMERPIVHLPIVVEASEEMDKKLRENPFFKGEETKAAILTHASLLKETTVTPEEIAIQKELMERTAFEIQETHGNRASLSAFVDQLDNVILAPGEVFSFLEKTDDVAGVNDVEARQFFASVLYSVVLQSETKIIERHSQNEMPTYLQPGIEVDISARLNRDFSFQNSSETPMLFGASMDDRHLLIELYTINSTSKVTYSVVETEVKPRTIYRLSSTLKSGQEKVIQNSSSGYRVTVYKTFYDEVLGYEVDEEVSRDFYPPVHKVIAVAGVEEQSQATESNGEKETDEKPDAEGKEPEQPSNPSNDNQDSKEDLQQGGDSDDEVIYDKGGNVIYDPNA